MSDKVYLKATMVYEMEAGQTYGEFQKILALKVDVVHSELHQITADMPSLRSTPIERQNELWKDLYSTMEYLRTLKGEKALKALISLDHLSQNISGFLALEDDD
jgi:hypothetical protein